MWLVRSAIKRPVLVAMFVLAFVVLGARAYRELVLELFPSIDFPYVVVATVYPGANPEEVETKVTKPIEDAVSTISGVRHIRSQSGQGSSVAMIEFELETDVDEAAAEVRSRINSIRMELPDEIKEPVVMKFDVGALPVLSLAMTGERPMWQIRKLAEDVVVPRLSRIPGVAQVSVTGGEQREIQVNVFKDRLAANNLSLNDVVRSLGQANLNIPAGAIRQKESEFLIRAIGEFTDLAQIRDTVIRFGDRRMGWMTSPVRVRDVADVEDTVADKTILTRLNGKDSVGVSVMRRSDANTVEVVESAKKTIKELEGVLPPDISFAISLDQSSFVLSALNDIRQALLMGIVLAMLVVLLFLRDWRGTLIVSLAIPISIVATFLVVRFLGYSLNFMVMLGLALAVGTLVDSAIVVLENIYRHLEAGELPEEAAQNATTELGAAITATTMTNLVVFVPMIFLGAIVGQFFRPFATTVVSATVFALLVAFTFTPMLAARVFKRRKAADSKQRIADRERRTWWRRIDENYEALLRWALGNRALVLVMGNLVLLNVLAFMMPFQARIFVAGITVIIGVIGALLAKKQRKGFLTAAAFLAVLMLFVQVHPRFGFMPQTDQGMVHLILELPPHYGLERTDKVMRRVERFVSQNLPEVESHFTNVGTTGIGAYEFGNFGPQFANIFLKLVDRTKRQRSDKEISESLSLWARRNIPEAIAVEAEAQSGMMRMGAMVQLEVLGQDRQTLIKISEKIRERLAQLPEVRDLKISWRPGRPEMQIKVDREKAADMGFTTFEVGFIARTAFEGNTDFKFRENGEEYPIRIRIAPKDRQSPDDVASLFVGPGMNDTPVMLGELAKVEWGEAPVTLERKDRQNMIVVSANLAPWASLGNVQGEIQKVLKGMDTAGAKVNFGGMFEVMEENMEQLGNALQLSIILLFMLMAALFNSPALPLSIMLTVPQALVGAFLLLMLTGKEWNIVSVIGIIMVLGLVVNAAIILVDYTQILRERGMERLEAVVLAGRTRLRPVLMTVLTTVFAAMPTALEWGRGTELRSPMAIAVIGGLSISTLLTLLVVPVAYTVVDDAVQAVRRLWRRK